MKLQSSTMDIVDAYKQIDEVKQFYKEIRGNVDMEFHKVYTQAERMAAAVDVEPPNREVVLGRGIGQTLTAK